MTTHLKQLSLVCILIIVCMGYAQHATARTICPGQSISSVECGNNAFAPYCASTLPTAITAGSDPSDTDAMITAEADTVCGGSSRVCGYTCGAAIPTDGTCGTANGGTFASAPTTDLCGDGSTPTVSGGGPWTWTCAGSGGGADASCSANKTPSGGSVCSLPPGGVCCVGSFGGCGGSGPGGCVEYGPWQPSGDYSTNYSASITLKDSLGVNHTLSANCTGIHCSSTATAVIDGVTYTWTVHNNIGAQYTAATISPMTSFCTTTPVNGTCGGAHNVKTINAPTANLCGDGSTPAVTLSGTDYVWTCAGSGGGSDASCSAPKITNGACGAAHGVPSATAPAAGLCSAGTASAVTGTGPWAWTCAGINGGTTSNCDAPTPPPPPTFGGACP